MMQKIKTALLAAVLAIATAHAASAQTRFSPWVEGKVGHGNAATEVGITGVPVGLDGLSGTGYTYGLGAGVDAIIGRFMVGVGVSYQFADLETTLTLGPTTLRASYGDLWDVYGRLGYRVWDGAYLYGKLGYGGTDLDLSDFGQGSLRFTGLTAGIGGEMKLSDQASVKLEWTHYLLEEKQVAGLVDLSPDVDVVSAALVWRPFGGSSDYAQRDTLK